MNESAEHRSAVMRAVKAKGTRPELFVRKILTQLGIRYRLHSADLPGKPDIYFRGRKKVIFINGCFWHGHSCKRGDRMPVNNASYWRKKIDRNCERDEKNITMLTAAGWKILVLWECELKNEDLLKTRLLSFIEGHA